MKQKLRHVLVFLFLSVLLPISVCADDALPPSDKPFPTGPTKIDFGKRPKPSRPHAPSAQIIEGFYDGESLSLAFAIPEGMCTLIVESPDQGVVTYEFDSASETEVIIGSVSCASLTLETELGHTYYGAIE